jgi:hypothetical protein
MFPYYFFDLPSPSSTPRDPIDTKSFSTGETMDCYVINYAPETGQPCYRLQIRNVQGITNKSWLRLGLQCEPRETPTEAEKLVRTARSTGNDTQSSN